MNRRRFLGACVATAGAAVLAPLVKLVEPIIPEWHHVSVPFTKPRDLYIWVDEKLVGKVMDWNPDTNTITVPIGDTEWDSVTEGWVMITDNRSYPEPVDTGPGLSTFEEFQEAERQGGPIWERDPAQDTFNGFTAEEWIRSGGVRRVR